MSNGPSFSNTNEQSGEGASNENKQAMEINEGTVVKGDVTGDVAEQIAKTTVEGDMHGDVNQTNVKNGDVIQQVKEQLETVGNELSKAFVPPADEGSEPAESVPFEIGGESFDPIEIEPELHPAALMTEMNSFLDAPEPPTEEEAEGWAGKFKSMIEKGGAAVAKTLKTIGPPAISGLEALASVPFPANIAVAVLKTAVNQATSD